MSRLRSREEEQDVIGNKVLCVVTEGSTNEEAEQLKYRKAVVADCGSPQAETRTEQLASSTVLDVHRRRACNSGPAHPREGFCRSEKKMDSARNTSNRCVAPLLLRL